MISPCVSVLTESQCDIILTAAELSDLAGVLWTVMVTQQPPLCLFVFDGTKEKHWFSLSSYE